MDRIAAGRDDSSKNVTWELALAQPNLAECPSKAWVLGRVSLNRGNEVGSAQSDDFLERAGGLVGKIVVVGRIQNRAHESPGEVSWAAPDRVIDCVIIATIWIRFGTPDCIRILIPGKGIRVAQIARRDRRDVRV
ncbi:MAG TPA: hypothetical protein VH559_11330 [Gemmatimonadaceae bacterium]